MPLTVSFSLSLLLKGFLALLLAARTDAVFPALQWRDVMGRGHRHLGQEKQEDKSFCFQPEEKE